MPLSARTRSRSKRTREQSPEDNKANVVASASTAEDADAQSPSSGNKRPRLKTAVQGQTRMEVKEEVIETPPSASSIKADSNSAFEPGASKASIPRKGRNKAVPKPDPEAGPSEPRTSTDRRTADETSRSPSPSSSLSENISTRRSQKTSKKAAEKGPSKRETKEREKRWKAWCDERKWIRQYDSGYKQKVNDCELHRSDGTS